MAPEAQPEPLRPGASKETQPDEELQPEPERLEPATLIEARPADMGSMLRRSAWRGGVLGLALAATQVLGTLVVALVVWGVGDSPRGAIGKLLTGGVMSSVFWVLAGLPVAPLAFVELLASSKPPSLKLHVRAALWTIPLSYLVLFALWAQGYYAYLLLVGGLPFQEAVQRVLDDFSTGLGQAGPLPILALFPLVAPVALTTFARLRKLSHRQQIAAVLGGTVLASIVTALTLAGLGALSQSRSRIDISMALVCSTSFLSLFLGTLLPGAYQRADQIEAWLKRRYGSDD